MSLNVNRQIQDAFYRYKMPRLQAKVEGKGNGVKTVIPNMADIARALGRPPTCKWFHVKKGTCRQINFTEFFSTSCRSYQVFWMRIGSTNPIWLQERTFHRKWIPWCCKASRHAWRIYSKIRIVRKLRQSRDWHQSPCQTWNFDGLLQSLWSQLPTGYAA